MKKFNSTADIADFFGTDEFLIKTLLENHFFYEFEKNEIFLNKDDFLIIDFIKNNSKYRDVILDLGSTYFNELKDGDFRLDTLFFEYLIYHDTLDKFCWLIKLYYSDKKTIKNKHYKLDVLFQNFIKNNKYNHEKITKNVSSELDLEKSIFHLKKGWYNELVRSVPFSEDFLEAGTNIKGKTKFSGAIAWNIIQSYYSYYEYTNALVFTEKSDINTKEHNKTLKIFSNDLYSKLSRKTLFYPFNINSQKHSNKQFQDFYKYEYALYPRLGGKDIKGLDNDIFKMLDNLSKNNQSKNTFIDFFYDFRVWANYTGIETVVKLKNGGYLEFLKRNLSLIVFFMGGITELALLPLIGEEEFLKILKEFNSKYILNHEEYGNPLFNPIFARFRIYKHLGIITQDTSFLVPKNIDPLILI